MKKHLKSMFLGFIPALILGSGFFFLVSSFNGMKKIADTSHLWILIGFIIFEILFVLANNGKNIFGRFLKYLAYECWLIPLCVIIYTIISMSQAHGVLGAAGIGISGFLLIFVVGIGGGLLGLVFYLIGNAISKNKVYMINEVHEKNSITQQTDKKSAALAKSTTLKYASFIIVGVIVIIAIGVFSERENNKQHITSSPSTEQQKGYTLNSAELAVLDSLLKDDAKVFTTGGKALLQDDLISTSASKIAAAYNENQVAADQQYNDKLIFLSGRIQGINSGLGNEPYLVLYGMNLFLSPQAHFQDGNTQKIASLKRNQTVNLVCKGNGAIIGTPMFKDCQFPSDYAEQRISKLKIEISDFLKGEKTDSKIVEEIALYTIFSERMLPVSSSCFTTEAKKCPMEISAIFNEKNAETKLNIRTKLIDVANELKSSGVDVTHALDAMLNAVDEKAKKETQQPLEQPTTTKGQKSNSGDYHATTPKKTHRHAKRVCRESIVTATIDGIEEKLHRTVCQQPDGKWKIQA